MNDRFIGVISIDDKYKDVKLNINTEEGLISEILTKEERNVIAGLILRVARKIGKEDKQ